MLSHTGGLPTIAWLLIGGSVCAQSPATIGLAGTSWHLVRFEDEKGHSVAPDDPAKYYISFGELIVARLDCNIGRATWNVSGSDLHFGELARTHDACSPGSMSERIAHDWPSISSYRILDGALLLKLKDGHGEYVFEPDPPRKPGGLSAATEHLQRYAEDSQKVGSEAPTTMFASPFIVFDTKGVNFGPWVRRLIARIKRNWSVPPSAMALRGHSIVAFDVHKDGRITDVRVVTPSRVDSFNEASKKAVESSSPIDPLPPAYPDEMAHFTVTFFYNEAPSDTPATVPPQ